LFLFDCLSRSGSGYWRLLGLCFKTLLREGLEIALAEKDFEMLVEGCAELLELTGVWRQKRNIGALVLALTDQVPD
jgi:hypothetical protein